MVDNSPNSTIYPQRADFTFYGGIYRDVTLITVPRSHFALDDHGGPGLVVTPTLDGSRATVTFEAAVTGGDSVRFAIDGVGTQSATVVDGTAHGGHRDRRRATVARRARSAPLPRDRKPAGRRRRRRRGDVFASVAASSPSTPTVGFLLNGEPYPLRGVSRHQDWEGVGNAITTDMMQTDLALIQEIGATTVRLAHYQHDQHFYDLCDAAGIVVWAEIPQITEFLPDGTANATSQLTELIVQNRHHASIVCWGLSNEITVTGNPPAVLEAHRELNALAHRLDPTRPTAMAHLFLLETDHPLVTVPDVLSYNLYFGWYVGDVADNDTWLDDFRAQHPGVAIGLSEYGADANYQVQTGAPVRGDYSEQFQARYHEHMIEMINARPWLWATHVWNLADFAADGRDEGGVPGRNQKGLVNFDRTVKKDAFYAYKAAWSAEPFVHIAGRRYVDRPEETTEVTVYSNQPEVSLWVDGNLVGTQDRATGVPLRGAPERRARTDRPQRSPDRHDRGSTRRRAEPRLLGRRVRGRQLVRHRRAAEPRRLLLDRGHDGRPQELGGGSAARRGIDAASRRRPRRRRTERRAPRVGAADGRSDDLANAARLCRTDDLTRRCRSLNAALNRIPK